MNLIMDTKSIEDSPGTSLKYVIKSPFNKDILYLRHNLSILWFTVFVSVWPRSMNMSLFIPRSIIGAESYLLGIPCLYIIDQDVELFLLIQ